MPSSGRSTFPQRRSSGPGAGMRAADVILAIDGKTTDSVTTLQSVLAALKPGDQVRVRLSRDGTQSTVTATLGTLTS